MFHQQPWESDSQVTRTEKRLSFIKKLRSLAGRSADKRLSPQTITWDSFVTSPAPPAPQPPPPPPLSSAPATKPTTSPPLSISTPGWHRPADRRPTSPPGVKEQQRRQRSRSLGHACCGASRRGGDPRSSSPPRSSTSSPRPAPADAVPSRITGCGLLASSLHRDRQRRSGDPWQNPGLSQQSARRGAASGHNNINNDSNSRRASSGGDVMLPKGGIISSSKVHPSRAALSSSKSCPVTATLDESTDPPDPRGPAATRADSSPSKSDLSAAKGEKERRPRDGSTGREASCVGARPKSVCVVAPSDAKTMILRRAYSEKGKAGTNMAAVKSAPLTRHASLWANTRKSMSSLEVEQGAASPEPDGGAETPEAQQRESRKSANSSTNESASSHTADTVTLRNSISAVPAESKKADECPSLPSYVSKSKNAKFHKLFKNVPLNEYPIDTYSCAFKGDILLQGMMYVSQNWICFYSKIRARGRLLEIPLEKVISITREKLCLIIPNAIGIQIAEHKYVFGSFMSRDNTYKLLVTLLKHVQDSANIAGRLALSAPPLHPEHVTHSADISNESDTTEDDDDNAELQKRERLMDSAPSSSSSVNVGGECGDRNLGVRDHHLHPSDKVPGFLSWKCINHRKMAVAFTSFALKLQKVPRTNLLLAVCTVMVVFLLLSAAGLNYKILVLQTRLEMSPLWAARHTKIRDPKSYWVEQESQRATLHRLHDVLKANIELLDQVHQSLKHLQRCAATEDCPPDQ